MGGSKGCMVKASSGAQLPLFELQFLFLPIFFKNLDKSFSFLLYHLQSVNNDIMLLLGRTLPGIL